MQGCMYMCSIRTRLIRTCEVGVNFTIYMIAGLYFLKIYNILNNILTKRCPSENFIQLVCILYVNIR